MTVAVRRPGTHARRAVSLNFVGRKRTAKLMKDSPDHHVIIFIAFSDDE